jgi:hypothetical protein
LENGKSYIENGIHQMRKDKEELLLSSLHLWNATWLFEKQYSISKIRKLAIFISLPKKLGVLYLKFNLRA